MTRDELDVIEEMKPGERLRLFNKGWCVEHPRIGALRAFGQNAPQANQGSGGAAHIRCLACMQTLGYITRGRKLRGNEIALMTEHESDCDAIWKTIVFGMDGAAIKEIKRSRAKARKQKLLVRAEKDQRAARRKLALATRRIAALTKQIAKLEAT